MDLFAKILSAYQRRETDVTSCFWAQLAKIAEIITPQAMRAGADVAVWQRDVVQVNRVRSEIAARDYGGWNPYFGFKASRRDMIFLCTALAVFLFAFLCVAVPRFF
jgi:hypothetical protein